MIILASQSPRRSQIMRLVGIEFTCIPSGVEEVIPEGTPIEKQSEYLAGLKAMDVAAGRGGDIVIGSDTLVEIDGEMLGKPADEAEAAAMLRRLSGRSHKVYTGVCIVNKGEPISFTSVTKVYFKQLSGELINWYISTGDTLDKAGAYGIQGPGAALIEKIDGDYFTVMGFPIARVMEELEKIYGDMSFADSGKVGVGFEG